MDRLEAFEKMLADMQQQAEKEHVEIEKMKAAGKEKTALTGSISAITCFIR